MPKTCEKRFYKNIRVVLCKKPLVKTPNIPKMRRFSKWVILQRLQTMQRLQPLQNGQFGSKIKNAKNMQKTILQEHQSCFVRKTARKNTKYSRNETILKIGYLCKILTLGQKLKFQKTSQNPFYKSFRVVLCKNNRFKKTPNIAEMRRF